MSQHARNNIKVFVSYKKQRDAADNVIRGVAHKLAEFLDETFEVFIDEKEIAVGRKWADEIYRNIHESDVLIVVIEKETAESDWVQREVDVARGANVSILPLRVGAEDDTAGAVGKLALYDIQHFMDFDIDDPDECQRLLGDIERLSAATRKRQRDWVNQVSYRRRPRVAPTDLSAGVFKLKDSDSPLRVHLATGNMTDFKGVDAVVNSENDYMQMARASSSSALSSALRLAGSHITAGRIREDTVQAQLDYQIANSDAYCGRPIVIGQVVPTFAGHPESRLVKRNGVRYMLHVATVRVDAVASQNSLTWIETDAGIRQATIHTLEMCQQIDDAGGDIFAEPREGAVKPQHDILDPYQPIERLVVPLFGTGAGGRSVPEIIPPMLDGIDAHARANPDANLRHVHLCVFMADYVEVVRDIMGATFDPTT